MHDYFREIPENFLIDFYSLIPLDMGPIFDEPCKMEKVCLDNKVLHKPWGEKMKVPHHFCRFCRFKKDLHRRVPTTNKKKNREDSFKQNPVLRQDVEDS